MVAVQVENGLKKLTVLSRTYCHLCDDMIAALQALQGRILHEPHTVHDAHKAGVSSDIIAEAKTETAQFVWEVLDIDLHPELESQYGDKVPVLLAHEDGAKVELFYHFMDEKKLLTYLRQEVGR